MVILNTDNIPLTMNKESQLMDEAQKAWKLWKLIHDLSETLWEYYESRFMEFCMEEHTQNREQSSEKETHLPF